MTQQTPRFKFNSQTRLMERMMDDRSFEVKARYIDGTLEWHELTKLQDGTNIDHKCVMYSPAEGWRLLGSEFKHNRYRMDFPAWVLI